MKFLVTLLDPFIHIIQCVVFIFPSPPVDIFAHVVTSRNPIAFKNEDFFYDKGCTFLCEFASVFPNCKIILPAYPIEATYESPCFLIFPFRCC